MFVLGIDPGLTRCGYGVVSRTGRRLRAEAAGVIRTSPETDLAYRLAELQEEVRALIGSTDLTTWPSSGCCSR